MKCVLDGSWPCPKAGSQGMTKKGVVGLPSIASAPRGDRFQQFKLYNKAFHASFFFSKSLHIPWSSFWHAGLPLRSFSQTSKCLEPSVLKRRSDDGDIKRRTRQAAFTSTRKRHPSALLSHACTPVSGVCVCERLRGQRGPSPPNQKKPLSLYDSPSLHTRVCGTAPQHASGGTGKK